MCSTAIMNQVLNHQCSWYLCAHAVLDQTEDYWSQAVWQGIPCRLWHCWFPTFHIDGGRSTTKDDVWQLDVDMGVWNKVGLWYVCNCVASNR